MTEESNKKTRQVLGLKIPPDTQVGNVYNTMRPAQDNGRSTIVGKKGAVVVITKNNVRGTRGPQDENKIALTVDEKKRRLEALALAESQKEHTTYVKDNMVVEHESDANDFINNQGDTCSINSTHMTSVAEQQLQEHIVPQIVSIEPVVQQPTEIIANGGKNELHSTSKADVEQNPSSTQATEKGISTPDKISTQHHISTQNEQLLTAADTTHNIQQSGMSIEGGVLQYHKGKILKRMSVTDLKKQGKMQNLDLIVKPAKISVADSSAIDEIEQGTRKTDDDHHNEETEKSRKSVVVAQKDEKVHEHGKYKKYGFHDGTLGAKELDDVQKKDGTSKKIKDKAIKHSQHKFNHAQLMRLEVNGDGESDVESQVPLRIRRKSKKNAIKQQIPKEKVIKDVLIPDFITVQELALRASEKSATIIKELVKLGIIATINQVLDADTSELVITELGHTPKRCTEDERVKELLRDSINPQHSVNQQRRAPIVTVMGHVDHGKTSLLDALRSTDVVSGESGGITQHIGAYEITTRDGKRITFIDTPGHEAFTAMRTRGANVTDIVVLVVAADDGVKAQTVEAINHAKAANVPVIVAINKIDLPSANITYVTNALLQCGLVPEEMGGETMIVPVSAKNKIGLEQLEEAILFNAELMELMADCSGPATGNVIEAKVDKGRGVTTTLLVRNGVLQCGDLVVAGHVYGRIRVMHDSHMQPVSDAGPSSPVEILGLNSAPTAGDSFVVLKSEKTAKELADLKLQQEKMRKIAIRTKAVSVNQLFTESQFGVKELAIIVKADVQGSVEAIVQSLLKFANQEIKANVIHHGVGSISESDITLANTAHAIMLGFNVRPNAKAKIEAQALGVEIRCYSIIYDLLDDVKNIMSGMLAPIAREKMLGTVAVKKIFNLSRYGKIAGCYVTDGVIKRGANIRVLRDNMVIHTGKLSSLKRQKEDVKEVKAGFECGISIENFDDIMEQDVFEVFEKVEEARQFEAQKSDSNKTHF